RHDRLQPRNRCRQSVQGLRVLGRGAQPGSRHRAHHEWYLGLAAEHVAELRRLIQKLIEADADEVYEHELRYGAEASRCRTDRHTDETGLADRCVDDAVCAEA